MQSDDQIDKILEFTKENNDLLKKMYRHSKFNFYGNILYWLFIIVFVFGLYFFLRPVLDLILISIFHLQEFVNKLDAAANNSNILNIKELINSLNK